MKIGTGFGLALAILAVIGIIAYRSIVKLTDTADWVDHTHQVLEGLEGVLSTMKDAETGQRGYSSYRRRQLSGAFSLRAGSDWRSGQVAPRTDQGQRQPTTQAGYAGTFDPGQRRQVCRAFGNR